MKSFGIAMVVLGAFIGLTGLYFAFTVPDTASWTCIAQTGTQSSTCSYQAGASDASDPGTALKTSTGAIALCVVGAGVFAGGMAAAAGASHPTRTVADGPPPGPGGAPVHGPGAASYGGYGQPSSSSPPGQQQPPPYGQNR